jgi:hypothetical protein
LRVLVVSTSYPRDAQDWRGRFVADMMGALGRQAVQCLLWAPRGDLPPEVYGALLAGDEKWLARLADRGGIAALLRRRKPEGGLAALGLLWRLRRLYREQRADVVHVNWLQNALPLYGTRTPALITVLGSDYALLKLPGMVTMLRRMLRQRRAILAPNAAWMVPPLERLFGDVAEVRAMPFGVDAPWFEVKRTAGEVPRIWLVVSRVTKAKIGPLFDWGEGLFGGSRQLHLFGPMQEDMEVPAWVHYHGPSYPVELREKWFPRASGLISLSRHDEGRPQVLLEAMAAGLPVIASGLPAHDDVVRNGETGYLVDTPEAFRAALDRLSCDGPSTTLGESARRWVREEIGTWDDCAVRYVAAYRELLEEGA